MTISKGKSNKLASPNKELNKYNIYYFLADNFEINKTITTHVI